MSTDRGRCPSLPAARANSQNTLEWFIPEERGWVFLPWNINPPWLLSLHQPNVTLCSSQGVSATGNGFTEGRQWRTVLVDEGTVTRVTHLDLRKVFDTVPHSILVPRLERQGFPGRRRKGLVVTLSCGRWLGVRVQSSDKRDTQVESSRA